MRILSPQSSTQRHLTAVALLCLAAVSASPARATAITYDITFVPTVGAGLATGSFAYDTSTTTISRLTPTWAGFAFSGFAYTDFGPTCGTGDAGLFALPTQTCPGLMPLESTGSPRCPHPPA